MSVIKLSSQTNLNRSLNLENLMEQFMFYKKAQGVAERTLSDYQNVFRRFKTFADVSVDSFHALKHSVLEFLSGFTDKAPATYNIPYSNLKAFFNWCVEEGYIEDNPITALKLKRKRDEGRARNIDHEVLKKLLDTVDVSTYAGLRDYALIVLTLDTGIRPKEAMSLKIEDVDFIRSTLTIGKGIAKTRIARILPLSFQTLQVLKKLLAVKPDEWEDNLFMTVDGRPMTVGRWEKRVSTYSKKIGHKIACYDLRHTFAIMFLRNNGNVFALQHELGHTDLAMTKRYVKLAESDLKEQHAVASPVNNFLKRTTRVQKLFRNGNT